MYQIIGWILRSTRMVSNIWLAWETASELTSDMSLVRGKMPIVTWCHIHFPIRLSTWLSVHFTPCSNKSDFFHGLQREAGNSYPILQLFFPSPRSSQTQLEDAFVNTAYNSLLLGSCPWLGVLKCALPQLCFCSSKLSRPNSNAILNSLFPERQMLNEWSVEWEAVGGRSPPGHGHTVWTAVRSWSFGIGKDTNIKEICMEDFGNCYSKSTR